MVTSAKEKKKQKDIYRQFLIGQKQLPEIVEGKSTSEEKNWALNILTTFNQDDIHSEFLSAEYTTETRGKRRLAAAVRWNYINPLPIKEIYDRWICNYAAESVDLLARMKQEIEK
jgi:hypothetical protein